MIGKRINKPVITEEQCNAYYLISKWCLKNNAYIADKGDYFEVCDSSQVTLTIEEQIEELKHKLAATDYKCLKYVDGEISEEDYAEIRNYRATLRKEINKLQEEM